MRINSWIREVGFGFGEGYGEMALEGQRDEKDKV